MVEPDPMKISRLRELAESVATHAYAPYSNFAVGSAVLASDGRSFSGCNVENSSFGLTICAERSAIFQAIAAGGRPLVAVVIFAGEVDPVPPCGACRQVISEFGPDAEVYSFSKSGRSLHWKLRDLLPGAFGPGSLPRIA